MGLRRTVRAKPDHPAWAELVAGIESVVSLRYVEDPDAPWGPSYAPSEEEPGFSFESLNRRDRQNVLADMVSWGNYESQGISHAQLRIVIANVLDDKPPEKWLDGVFDEAVLENDKIASFEKLVTMMKYSPENHVFEEMDGDRLPWDDLSAAAKLQYIVRDAVIADVRFEAFAQVARDTIADVGEAALRVVLEGQKELHAIAKLFPDDGRTESPPLVDQVKDMLDYVSALEKKEKERGLSTELKDHGKSENPPSHAARETTDDERKQVLIEAVRRLDAAYMAAGADALAKMNGLEIFVLYYDKLGELESVRANLAEHGDNEIGQLHQQKLERQTADMAAWMRVHCPDFREIEEAKRREAAPEKGDKMSLADLRGKAQGEQPEKQATKDKGLER
jgi:hypothetical protein